MSEVLKALYERRWGFHGRNDSSLAGELQLLIQGSSWKLLRAIWLLVVTAFCSAGSRTVVVHLQRQNIDLEALNLETVLQAANYLDIKGLLDVTCKTVANMIKGKTPEEIRKTFNIKNDFTEEEEAQVLDLGLIIT